MHYLNNNCNEDNVCFTKHITHIRWHTYARHSSIFVICTVTWKSIMAAFYKSWFRSNAAYVSHMYVIQSPTKVESTVCGCTWMKISTLKLDYWQQNPHFTKVKKSKLFTNYSSVRSGPIVVTNCSPLVIVAHFHPSLKLVSSTHQTNITISTSAYIWNQNERTSHY